MSDIYYMISYFFLFSRGYGNEAPLTTCQHGITFSCRRKGPQLLFPCHFTNYLFQAFQNKEMKCTKISLLTDILASYISHFYWHESKMYIPYCFQLLTTWLISNICFWAVFSHLSSFEIPHILGIWDIIYISGDISDWQIIASMHM